jgi:hypothetical protein
MVSFLSEVREDLDLMAVEDEESIRFTVWVSSHLQLKVKEMLEEKEGELLVDDDEDIQSQRDFFDHLSLLSPLEQKAVLDLILNAFSKKELVALFDITEEEIPFFKKMASRKLTDVLSDTN